MMCRFPTYKLYVFVLLLSGLLTACNNEIFVDDTRLQETEVTLDGDGGEYTFRFSLKKLEKISILTPQSGNFIGYYDKNDNKITEESQVNDVARIEIANRYVLVNVYIDGEVAHVVSTEVADEEEFSFVMLFDYGNNQESIMFTLLPGRPMEFEEISYAWDYITPLPSYRENIKTVYYSNNSSQEQKFKFYPYSNCLTSVAFSIMEKMNIQAVVNVPVADTNGVWREGNFKIPVEIGDGTEFYFEHDSDTWVEITVPPMSKVSVSGWVEYVSAEIPFFMHLRNPLSDRTYLTSGDCIVNQPVNFNIQINEAQ